jgi:hypothetical protein
MRSGRIRSLNHFLVILLGLVSFADSLGAATTIPSLPDLSGVPDPNTVLSPAITNAIVKSVGLGLDYRAYEPATPLGTALGLDIGIEATLAKPPPEVSDAISTLTSLGGGGSSGAGTQIPVLPSARFNIHKGIGNFVDLGFSYLPSLPSVPYIGKSSFIGGEIKICLYRPEEGVTWSIRGSYNVNTLKVETVTIKTTTITPQLLISKQLDFADPYIGAGFQYTSGYVEAQIDVPPQPAPAPVFSPIVLKENGKGSGGIFFGGLSLKVPNVGLRLTIEMAYSTASMSYLGSKIGFSF